MTIKSTILPALPGYYVLAECIEDDNSVSAIKIPVIAWCISGFADRKPGDEPPRAEPISYDDQSGSSAILAPDGTVIDPFNSSWDSLEAWVVSRNAERKKAHAAPQSAPPVNLFATKDNNKKSATLTLSGRASRE